MDISLGNVLLSPTMKKLIVKDLKKSNVEVDDNIIKNIYISKSIDEFNAFSYVYMNKCKLKQVENCMIFEHQNNVVSKRSFAKKKMRNIHFAEMMELCSISKQQKQQLKEELKNCIKPEVKSFELLKKNQKNKRVVYKLSNESELKIQQKICRYLNLLQNSLTYNCNTYAYMEGKSYKDYLKCHCGCQVVLKFDIVNFFQSITEKNLASCLKKYIKDEAIIKLLLNKTIINEEKDSFLGQGLPLAAPLSNLYLLEFDMIMQNYCSEKKLNYSRYSDDIIISSRCDIDNSLVEEKVVTELLNLNLDINKRKTQKMEAPIKVSGIYIKDTLEVPSNRIKLLFNTLVKMLNSQNMEELNDALEKYQKKNVNKHRKAKQFATKHSYKTLYIKYMKEIHGKIQYYIHINPNTYTISRLIYIYNLAANKYDSIDKIYNIPAYSSTLHLFTKDNQISSFAIQNDGFGLYIEVSESRVYDYDYAISYVGGKEKTYELCNEYLSKISLSCENAKLNSTTKLYISELLLDIDIPKFKFCARQDLITVSNQIEKFWNKEL